MAREAIDRDQMDPLIDPIEPSARFAFEQGVAQRADLSQGGGVIKKAVIYECDLILNVVNRSR